MCNLRVRQLCPMDWHSEKSFFSQHSGILTHVLIKGTYIHMYVHLHIPTHMRASGWNAASALALKDMVCSVIWRLWAHRLTIACHFVITAIFYLTYCSDSCCCCYCFIGTYCSQRRYLNFVPPVLRTFQTSDPSTNIPFCAACSCMFVLWLVSLSKDEYD